MIIITNSAFSAVDAWDADKCHSSHAEKQQY